MKFLRGSFKLQESKVLTGAEREKVQKRDETYSLISAIALITIGAGVIAHNLDIVRFPGDLLGYLSFVFIMLMAYIVFFGNGFGQLAPNDEFERHREDRAAAKAYGTLTLGLLAAIIFEDWTQKLSWLGVVLVLWGIASLVEYRELRRTNG